MGRFVVAFFAQGPGHSRVLGGPGVAGTGCGAVFLAAAAFGHPVVQCYRLRGLRRLRHASPNTILACPQPEGTGFPPHEQHTHQSRSSASSHAVSFLAGFCSPRCKPWWKAGQQEIGGEIVFFYHDSPPRSTRNPHHLSRHRKSGRSTLLNFAFVNRIQRKHTPL